MPLELSTVRDLLGALGVALGIGALVLFQVAGPPAGDPSASSLCAPPAVGIPVPVIGENGPTWRLPTGGRVQEIDGELPVRLEVDAEGAGQSSIVLRHLEANPDGPFDVVLPLRLDGWTNLRYVAAGWHDGDRFWHLRIKHLPQGEVHHLEIEPDSLAFALSNDWQVPEAWDGGALRVVVAGVPGAGGARLDVGDATLRPSAAARGYPVDTPGCTTSRDRFRAWYRERPEADEPILADLWREAGLADADHALEAAEAWLDDGVLLAPGLPPVPASALEAGADGAEATPTLRFRWHSLSIVSSLLQAHRMTGELEPLFHARDLVQAWASRNVDRPSDDPRYAWYDHGAGDRLLALSMLWEEGLEHGFGALTMERLFLLVADHAELLADPSFYARNQPERAHNHALFQDLALLAASSALSDLPASEAWRDLALRRLRWQLEALTTAEGASIENSLGYHQALETLCMGARAITDRLASTDIAAPFAPLCKRMRDFRDAMRYPGGGGPAYGDTWRRPDRRGRRFDWGPRVTTGEAIFEASGYAAVTTAAHPDRGLPPWQLDVINSSLSVTHKHQDHLSFTLWVDGAEWLRDSGYHGTRGDPLDTYSRSARAHNTFLACGEGYEDAVGVTSLERFGDPDGPLELDAEHRAYPDRVAGRRFRLLRDQGIVVLADRVDRACSPEEGPHELWFQLDEELEVEMLPGGVVVARRHGHALALVPPRGAECQHLVGRMEPRPAGWSFPAYGVGEPSHSLRCELAGSATAWETALVFDPAADLLGGLRGEEGAEDLRAWVAGRLEAADL